MKEIKFRAWDGFTMHRVGQLNWSFRNGITIVQAGNRPWSSNKPWKRIVDPVLMQYTGLKDKNGVEIYEGDIVKIPADLWIGQESVGNAKGTFFSDAFVEFVEGSFRLNKLGSESKNYYGVLNYSTNTYASVAEVIGNIYENPELLEAK